MDLAAHYDNLYAQSIQTFQAANFQTDPLIDQADTDQRLGITLLARPDAKTKEKIQYFLQQLAAIEPQQYYYADEDIHITILSLISCYEGFQLDKIDTAAYIALAQTSLEKMSPFKIHFEGITASSSCVMIQGFYEQESLTQVRDSLRFHFKGSNLQQSIDKRYKLQTAHSTVVRFRQEATQKAAFIEKLNSFRTYDFGSFEVEEIELVFNDWYMKHGRVQKLARFPLKTLKVN